MKTLNNYISERLDPKNLGSSGGPYYAYTPDEGTVVICNHPVDETLDYNQCEVTSSKKNIVIISWCDDNIYGYSLDNIKTESDLKRAVISYVKDWIKTNGDDAGTFDDSQPHVLPCGVELCTNDLDGKLTGEKVWEEWKDWINNTEADGDSSYCYVVVDLKNQEVIAGGGNVLFEY